MSTQPNFTDSLSDWEAAVPNFENSADSYGSSSTQLGSGSISYTAEAVDTVGESWNTWSSGYTGEVVDVGGSSETIDISGLTAFGFEVEPNPYTNDSITVTLSTGQTITDVVDGYYGAQFFGFSGSEVTSVTITDDSGDDFAFGNFFYASGQLFTAGDDTVDFNDLTPDQQAAIANGADIYHGLGGNDVVTLPNVANFADSVGSDATLGWTNTSASTFFTGSLQGQTYTVYGGDGDYFIVEGAGTEFIIINGDGASTITAGSGDDTISITGDGDNLVTAGTGPEEITFDGSGTNTFSGGDGNFAITATGGGVLDISGSLTEEGTDAVTIEDGAELQCTGAFSGTLAFPNSGAFYVEAPDGLNVSYVGDSADTTQEISLGVDADGAVVVVTVKNATVTYSDNALTVSGETYATLGGVTSELFQGSFTLPYNALTTASLSYDEGYTGTYKLAGLNVTFNELTLENDQLLAGFSLSLPFTDETSLTLNTDKLGINYGLAFAASGTQLVLGTSVSFPDSPPINVFGIFTGTVSNVSISYISAQDLLELQGTFTATQILGTSIQATVDFSGDNFIEYQNGTVSFAGSLTINGFSTPAIAGKAAFGLKEIDLSVNTKAETFSGGIQFALPFGGSAPEADVSLKGNWTDGPVITEVDVSGTNLGIVVPGTPDLIWQSGDLKIDDMFDDAAPTTFSGSLGFSFGPTLLGQSVGTLTLSGDGSSTQVTGTEQIQIVPYSLVSGLAGGSLSAFKSLFPFVSSSGTVVANFGNGQGFQNLSFVGTTQILGSFITIKQSFYADSDFDFTIAGSAAVNFGELGINKLTGLGLQLSANYLVSYTGDAPLSSDYAEAWATTTITGPLGFQFDVTIGVKADFDGDFSLLLSAPPSKDEAAVAEGAKTPSNVPSSVVFVTVTWGNAAKGAVALEVIDPQRRVITAADFEANDIVMVSALSTAYSETLAVINPVSTTGWSAAVVNPSGLGKVTVTTQTPAKTPTISSFEIADVLSATSLALHYAVGSAGDNSTLSFFADQTGRGHAGEFLGSASNLVDGAGSADIDLAELGNGLWHIYAMISNGLSVPGEMYADATLKVNGDAFTLSDSSRVTVSTFDIANAHFTSTVASETPKLALISEDFYTANDTLYFDYASSGASVATVETYQSALDAVTGGYLVVDSAADVFADLGGLQSDVAHIAAIRFTDVKTATLNASAAEATADAGALAKITSPYILEAKETNGDISTTGHGSGLTIEDVIGIDVITGGGSKETFVFHAGFGSARILDFYDHAKGAKHDTIDLAPSEFSSLTKLISDAKYASGNIELSAGADTLTLTDMNLKQFKAAVANGDFSLV